MARPNGANSLTHQIKGDSMKFTTLLLTLLLVPAAFAEDCANIAGSFAGSCYETTHDGTVKTYQIQYNIQQRDCEMISIEDMEQGYSVTHTFELNKGLSLQEEGQGYKVLTGGTFWTDDGAFAATILFINPQGNVDTVLSEFKKIEKGAQLFLKVTQTAPGSRMVCELPPIGR
jgi:hypothetical protein